MEIGSSPRTLTTRRCVKYRKSSWNVHEFEVWSGELVCRVSVLRMEKSLFIWLGGREAHLCEIALGMPMAEHNGESRSAVATVLLGEEGSAMGLARRLAFALARPIYVCCGKTFDRFSLPLVEKGIATEIKNHPEYF